MPSAQPLATKEPYGCGVPLAGASTRRTAFDDASEWGVGDAAFYGMVRSRNTRTLPRDGCLPLTREVAR